MVRRRGLGAFASGVGGQHSVNRNADDNNNRPKPAALRFQDVSNKALEDERRNQIKNKLIDAVKGDELENYRKSDKEVRTPPPFSSMTMRNPSPAADTPQTPQLESIKDKHVRQFYEDQNEALNDWLEVDSVVRSIADDIFESFDPDRDHDGLLESGGALQAQNEDVEAFLPKEERESRRKADRDAKRAINVRL